ncbi:HAUS augmin-like complex subunit 7 isoform X2 [Colossoma macropomum]|uniref:HAUS augmin-like complex subunit 7 isoform X2 n=1 Tax=Colossoma macropomum TaxID=42526 RepID=UPI0018653881|nr:HAUS augmin-like complex subunit 7 isoform X2 [Colossoma macropomum]
MKQFVTFHPGERIPVRDAEAMAGDSKQQQLSVRVYNTLQNLGCPLVDGLYLREADSMQELLCTPSLHRMDILKWICIRICPSLKEKFSTIKSAQTEEVVKEVTRFGHEMMLCKADDRELIEGFATPLRQLLFLEQLLMSAQDSSEASSEEKPSGNEGIRNDDLLRELMSPDHLSDLVQLMNPVCNPWSAHIREHLRATHSAQAKTNRAKANDSNRSHHHSTLAKLGGDDLTEATRLLQSTQATLEELRKECEFLHSDPVGPGASLSPCALKVAISDMAQLMTAFSQVYNTDFKGYCQRAPPVLSPNAHVFQSVHHLLHSCNMELEALQQLSETSSSLTETVRRIQTERRYWAKGEKHTLPNQLETLKNRYAAFLTHHQS